MPAKNKQIEDSIRERFIQAVDQIRTTEANIETIMKTVGDYQQAYTQMNTGKRYPTLKNIVLLCQCYGVSANWLLFGTGDNGLQQENNPVKRLAFIEQEVAMLKLLLGKKRRK